MPRSKVVVVGQGYVGLPIAVRAVEAGYDVVGIDTDKTRVDALQAGTSYVEDISDAALRAAMDTGRYRPSHSTADYQGFDFVIITVPTPLKESLPDLSYIEDSAREIGRFLRTGATVVLESTTYPGTTENLLVPILEETSQLQAGRDFHVGYSPERIDPGNKVFTFSNTPKVVSGIDQPSLAKVTELYRALVDEVVPVSSPKEAELTKLLENTFRHINIALVNELAVFAKELGIDVWEAIDAASTKPFGYMRFTPGPGVGGHCLPVDPSYLSWEVRRTLGHNFRFVELANDVNDHMPDYVVRRLILGLNDRQQSVKGSTVTLVGLAYKKNTGDARESPALRIAELLDGLGARVLGCDPYVEPHRLHAKVELAPFDIATTAASDALIVVTDHDCFDYKLLERADAYVLDTRHRLKGRRDTL